METPHIKSRYFNKTQSNRNPDRVRGNIQNRSFKGNSDENMAHKKRGAGMVSVVALIFIKPPKLNNFKYPLDLPQLFYFLTFCCDSTTRVKISIQKLDLFCFLLFYYFFLPASCRLALRDPAPLL